jgi:hypothetical protein
MYFPDDFARLTASSGQAHRFVARWMRRQWAKRHRPTKHLPTPAAPVGSQLCGTETVASMME